MTLYNFNPIERIDEFEPIIEEKKRTTIKQAPSP
jgi:hypothetical protein